MCSQWKRPRPSFFRLVQEGFSFQSPKENTKPFEKQLHSSTVLSHILPAVGSQDEDEEAEEAEEGDTAKAEAENAAKLLVNHFESMFGSSILKNRMICHLLPVATIKLKSAH